MKDAWGDTTDAVDEGRRATHQAVKLLGLREHSEKELRQKLGRQHRQDVVDAVIVRLADDGVLSDARFAEEYVRSRVCRGQGPVRIRAELRERGVAEDVADEAMARTDPFWLEQARRVHDKKFGDGLPDDRGDWARRARFLASRGFPSEIVYRTLGPQTFG